MRVGDRPCYWPHYRDEYMRVQLAVTPADDRVLHRSQVLGRVLTPPSSLDQSPAFSFSPPALTPGQSSVSTVMTGGRTFLLEDDSVEQLGWPGELALDLEPLGWGSESIEVRFEIKGAGTLFERTGLSPRALRERLAGNAALSAAFSQSAGDSVHPVLYASLKDYMRRNVGFQSELFALQAARASDARLGLGGIKFLPVWLAVAHTEEVQEALACVSEVLSPDVVRFSGVPAMEVRLTPSTVRASYLDRITEDRDLSTLCGRISSHADELWECFNAIVRDVPRYLTLMIDTRPHETEGFTWIKIGDINETFARTNGEYRLAAEYRKQRVGWYLLKDTVLARRVGAFFCDLEAYFGRDVGYWSHSWEELLVHHSLVILTVLRDHVRLLTQLRIGIALIEGGSVRHADRLRLQREVWQEIETAVNEVDQLDLRLTRKHVELQLCYRHLQLSHNFVIDRPEIAERYDGD
jgi:hypothetical protein